VLEAARDFSERRAEVFPAVSIDHMTIHALADTSADVTEGTAAGIGVNWERCRYKVAARRSDGDSHRLKCLRLPGQQLAAQRGAER
jgi:hypothetical protein